MQISYRIYVSFILAGDEESAIRLIENLKPSSVVNAESVDLAKLPKDVLGTSLIPDIDYELGHRIAVQGRSSVQKMKF